MRYGSGHSQPDGGGRHRHPLLQCVAAGVRSRDAWGWQDPAWAVRDGFSPKRLRIQARQGEEGHSRHEHNSSGVWRHQQLLSWNAQRDAGGLGAEGRRLPGTGAWTCGLGWQIAPRCTQGDITHPCLPFPAEPGFHFRCLLRPESLGSPPDLSELAFGMKPFCHHLWAQQPLEGFQTGVTALNLHFRRTSLAKEGRKASSPEHVRPPASGHGGGWCVWCVVQATEAVGRRRVGPRQMGVRGDSARCRDCAGTQSVWHDTLDPSSGGSSQQGTGSPFLICLEKPILG